MPDIHFFEEETRFKLPHPKITSRWILRVVESEKNKVAVVNFIFCSDKYLKRINLEYLAHDTFTDVITFDYSDSTGIQGDIFISIERVKENAQKFLTHFDEELHRVMVHGVLHLIGYSDKTKAAKSQMRKKRTLTYLCGTKFHVKPVMCEFCLPSILTFSSKCGNVEGFCG